MKILLINWQDRKNPLAGGAEIHVHEIFGRITKWGHQVTLLCSSFHKAHKREIVDGINVIRIGRRYNFNFFVPHTVHHLLAKNNYEIVIDDTNKIPFFTPLYVKNTPILVILHHLFGNSIYRETNPVFASYVNFSERLIPLVYKKEFFCVVSESTKHELVSIGLPPENIFVIHNGVSEALCPDYTKKSSIPTILIYGRIKKYKCPDICLYSMKKVILQIPTAKLVVAGEGDYLPALKRIANKLRLNNNVEFLGFVPEEKKRELLQTAWVAVNTSIKEGWGITIIEANACGTPVIASDSPGLRDSVVHEKTGFLVEHGNINQLASTIIRVLTDKRLRDTLSNSAVQWAYKFKWDEAAQKMLKLIEYVLKNNKSS